MKSSFILKKLSVLVFGVFALCSLNGCVTAVAAYTGNEGLAFITLPVDIVTLPIQAIAIPIMMMNM